MERQQPEALDSVLVAAAIAFGVAVFVIWAGAAIALLVTGFRPATNATAVIEALGNLPSNASNPASAWPEPYGSRLPGPVLYWLSTGFVATVVTVAAGVTIRLFGRSGVGTRARRPLGVEARPLFADRRDLRPLFVRRGQAGRFVFARFGRNLVATEAGSRSRRLRWLHRDTRVGDRGALALVGPSRSGKTTAAIGGILEWEGPAVLSSVKADLLGATHGWRSSLGEVEVFDPTGTTGVATARWSPVHQADTVLGAQRAARSLCDAAPRGGVDGGMDFWLAQAEILLSGLLFVARHARRDMGAVAEWILLQDRPDEHGPGDVRIALDAQLASNDQGVAVDAGEIARALVAIWEMEDRTRSSVYATAQTVIWPWSDPDVARSSRGDSVDLKWLIGGANTVYLCAPIEDQRRLAPAFGGLLNDLISQVYRHVARTGSPLDPPLLVVIDEAGNMPLKALPEYASTLAGMGVLLVTIWQSIAQLEATYGRQADTILTNHLSKVFYAGLSDPASIRYVTTVLGDAEVETRSRTARSGSGSIQLSTTRVSMTPAHALRQMRPGDALLVHGTLPPAHVRARAYYRVRRLKARAAHPIVECSEAGR